MTNEQRSNLLLLQEQQAKGKLSAEDATYLTYLMNKRLKEIKEQLEKKHTNTIRIKTKIQNGKKYEYYFTRINDHGHPKDIMIKEEYAFYMKLHDFYFGKPDVKMYTINDVYSKYIIERKADPSITSQTVATDESTYRRYLEGSEFGQRQISDIQVHDVLKFLRT